MKILIGCSSSVSNPFVHQMKKALDDHPAVTACTLGLDLFWDGPAGQDVLLLHWPEAFFRWKSPTFEELQNLEAVLASWAEQTLVISVVHNLRPHDRESANLEQLYPIVYKYCDACVHLSKTSVDLFKHLNIPVSESQRHFVIPHGSYDCFENTISKEEARDRLGFRSTDSVVLSFGAIRGKGEMDLLMSGFSRARIPNKHLLIAGSCPLPSKSTVKGLVYRFRLFLDPRYKQAGHWIEDSEVQLYLNASDVVVIPRIDTLNSGNVPLAFTFGRVAVGPNVGSIGEILKDTGNPIYDPLQPASLARALEEGLALATQGHGDANKAYSERHLNWEIISDQYVSSILQTLESQTNITPTRREFSKSVRK